MSTILDRYGIKEVCDVTFYGINTDGTRGAPVLYLDTLKVSTVEQTASQVEARGGKGNSPLIIWDFGKEINLNLEDALFSAKSMAMMFGSQVNSNSGVGVLPGVTKTILVTYTGNPYTIALPDGTSYSADPSDGTYYDIATGETISTQETNGKYYFTFTVPVATRRDIEISANTFPGTYYVTGDTYARSQITGKDEFFQLIIPKAKMSSSVTLTMQAEGDPSVFNMSLRVLRPDDGKMMKLVQYSVTASGTGATITSITLGAGSADVVKFVADKTTSTPTGTYDNTLYIKAPADADTTNSCKIKLIGTVLSNVTIDTVKYATGQTETAGKTKPEAILSSAVHPGGDNTSYRLIDVSVASDVDTGKIFTIKVRTNGNLLKTVYISVIASSGSLPTTT